MPENPSESIPPLDARNIHQLVRLMKKYDLTAIDLVDGPTKIRLRRQGTDSGPVPSGGWTAMPVAPSPTPVATAPPTAAQPAPTPATPPPSTDMVVESPMVGTFYSSPAPDAPPFVSVGSVVNHDTTVCVIEAMKVFTDIPAGIPAGTSGTITEVLVKSGQPVEFGQALFRVRPS
jgi:acetyl-CoA carboxylase biotin carboxyl carrier protein